MNFRFSTLVCLLTGLLIINGILLSKLAQRYFTNAHKGLVNETSVSKLFSESKPSLPEIELEDPNIVRFSDENSLIRLKRSIDSIPKESNAAVLNNSNLSITEFKNQPPAEEKYFTWNLNLNVSKYGNNFISQKAKAKPAGQAQTDFQISNKYLNMSLHLEGGGPRNHEELDSVWTSVGKFVRQLFKNESIINVSNDLDQKEEHQKIDPKNLIVEVSQTKHETPGSLVLKTSHEELPKTTDIVEVPDSSTVSLEGNDEESASKRKGGKFLFGLFGFGGSQSTKPPTEIDVGSGGSRSGPDVSDLINSSGHFPDVNEEADDQEALSFTEPENINLTNPLMSGSPSEEGIPSQSSFLIFDNDSFHNLPKPTAAVEENTSTGISFMMQDLSHEKVCSNCDSSDETAHPVTKNGIVREVAVFNLNFSQEQETNKSLPAEVVTSQSEHIVSIELFSKTSENTDLVLHSPTESNVNTELHPISEFNSEFQTPIREKLCTDCPTDGFEKVNVDSAEQSQTSSTDMDPVTKNTIVREVAVFNLNISQEHETDEKSLPAEVVTSQSEHNVSIEFFSKTSENTDFVLHSSTESNVNTELHPISDFNSEFQIPIREELCADCTTGGFEKVNVDSDEQSQTSSTDVELQMDNSNVAQINEIPKMTSTNSCSECTASETVLFSSEIVLENITATNLTEADLEKHCMKLIDVLANARNAIAETSDRNSTENQLNESQMELFKFLTNLINFILANRSPSTESITETENTTSLGLTSNETESNHVRVFSFDLSASLAEKVLTESSIVDLPEVGTEISNSPFIAECDAFIRRKQIKDNNKMFSKPNLMDIISDPNIGLHDFANATISPKLKEHQLQFLTDLLRGTKKEQSSTAETETKIPSAVEDEPNDQLSNSIDIKGSTEEILIAEFSQDQHAVENTDNETSTELLNDDKTKRLFLGSILNFIGLGSGERSINEIESFSNETELRDVTEESEIGSFEDEAKEKDERIFNIFEFSSSTERDTRGAHFDIETSPLVHTDEIVSDENKSRFFLGILGLDGSGDGRDLVQTDDLQTNVIKEENRFSDTESISTVDSERDLIQARTIPSNFENREADNFESATLLVAKENSECLEDCNLEKKLGIKVNLHSSSQTSDQNSNMLIETSNNTDFENDSNNGIKSESIPESLTSTIIVNQNLKNKDSTVAEMDTNDIDMRNFQDLHDSFHSQIKTQINLSTLSSGDFENKTTGSEILDEFGNGVGSSSKDVTESVENIVPFPDPRSPRRRGRLDGSYDSSQNSGRQPKFLGSENEFRFSTSLISEDGSQIDLLSKGNDSFTAELQTEQPEMRTGEVVQVSEFHSTTQLNTGPTVSRKPFQIVWSSTTESTYRRCNSASECNVFLNERCITIDKMSICRCGRSFFRNEKTGMCEAKILVETSVRLPEQVYSDELRDVTTERYKKMKEDSIQMMWYLLKENPDLFKMVADVDVLGFSPGSVVVHWSIILHPTTDSSLKMIHEKVETHLNETLQNEVLIESAPLDFRSAELIPLPMMDPCKNREFNYCSENAICQLADIEGGYTCECTMNMVDRSVNKNYTGEICEEKCPNNFCGLHGVCSWQNNRRLCLCSSYYFGERCDSSAVVWVAVSSVMCILMMMIVNVIMHVCRRIVKKLKRSRSGTSSRRLDEVIVMEEAPVRPQKYADLTTPRPGPAILVTRATDDSSISFDGDSTFDTTGSDIFAHESVRITSADKTYTV